MPELSVRLETLPRMWVASVRGQGESPESEAWRRLREWAGPKRLLGDAARHPVFGFNNPPPSPGREGYGYELWIRVDGPQACESGVCFKEFEGGDFAVTSCGLRDVGAAWRALWNWAQAGPRQWRRAQELEKVVDPNATEDDLVLELYLPVETTA